MPSPRPEPALTPVRPVGPAVGARPAVRADPASRAGTRVTSPSTAVTNPPHAASLPAPVTSTQRLTSVDTLRGVALLGILLMNIVVFALPGDAYTYPARDTLEPYQGAFTGANRIAWWVTYVLFDQKMMSIFSMLFGAGLILMSGRADERPAKGFAGIYYRRILVLLVIGLMHAYLVWYGDILVAYAICGVLLYPVRRLPAWGLILGGALICLMSVVITGLIGAAMLYLRNGAEAAQRVIESGGTPSPDQAGMLESYREMMKGMYPSQETVDESVALMRGSLPDVLKGNAIGAIMLQTIVFAIWTFWRALGLMLIGMGLMKLGVFAAARSRKFYTIMAVAGLVIGLALAAAGAWLQVKHNFDTAMLLAVHWHFNYIGSVFAALGYIGLVMLWCKAGAWASMQARLASVGRMALTNYLMQSLLMTSIFYGWGLGYFGQFERAELYFFVAGVWAVQLLTSPVWLRHFRFGPAEWAWRTATYLSPQPMRRRSISTEPLAS